MRRKRFVGLLGNLAALAAVQVTPALGQEFAFNVQQGYDTNVYEVNSGFFAPVAAHYSRLDAAYVSPSCRKGMCFLLRPEAQVTWYPQTSSANELAGSLSLGLKNVWRGEKSGGWRRKTSLGIDVFGAYERGLFLKRSIREELRIGAIPPSIPLADLPSRLHGGAQATVRTRAARGLTLTGSGFGHVREYVDSNDPSIPSFTKLDYRELGGLVEVSGTIADVWRLSGTGTLRDRAYPNRSARTRAGELVPAKMRKFWYWDLGASAEFDGRTLRNTLGVIFTRRQDQFEGYYSYNEWVLGNRLRVRLAPALSVRLRYSYGEKDYDIWAPTGSPTYNKYHVGRATVYVKPQPFWRLAVGLRYERSISNDPVFEYDRLQAIGEIEFVR